MTRRENPEWHLHFEVREDVCFARGAAVEQDPLAVSERLHEQHHHRLLSSLLGRGACSCFFPPRHAPNSSIPFMLFSPVWCRSLTSSSAGWGCQLPDGALHPELCSCTPQICRCFPVFWLLLIYGAWHIWLQQLSAFQQCLRSPRMSEGKVCAAP